MDDNAMDLMAESPSLSPVCVECAHLEDAALRSCAAFDEIPAEIWRGDNDHTENHPDDGGIQFKAIQNAAKSYALKDAADPREMAERRMQAALEVLFVKWAKQAAEKIKRGEVLGDEDIAAELRWAIEPQLVEAAADEGMRIAAEIGVQFDPAIVSAEMSAWAKNYSYEMVRGLTDTTRKVLQNAVSKYAATPGMTIGDLEKLIEPAFGAARAEAIAQTEITRSYSESMRYYQEQLAGEGVTMGREWLTNRDELVCFPPSTLVAVPGGYRLIEDLQPGDDVLSLSGPRKVRAISRREYDGDYVTLKAGEHWVTATGNHLFWISEQGWLQARDIGIGDRLELVGNDVAEVDGIFHYVFAQPKDDPALTLQKSHLACVSGGVLVPVDAIDLYSDSLGGKGEVYRIAPDSVFLLKAQTKGDKGMANLGFQQCLGSGTAIAREGAELAVGITRQATKGLAARLASDLGGRAAALLAAIVPVEVLFANKYLAAAFAGDVLGASQSASPATYRIPLSDRGIDREVLLADGAALGHLGNEAEATARGAELFVTLSATRHEIEGPTAGKALSPFAAALAFLHLKLHYVRWYRHMRALYHARYAKRKYVYNLEVGECQTFYANGILVHNCPICGPLHKKPEAEWPPEAKNGPPRHVRCRCSTRLVSIL